MSRVGKKPITIPPDVQVEIKNQVIKIVGPKGELSFRHRSVVGVEKKDSEIRLSQNRSDNYGRSVFGTTRSIIANMIQGVTEGYQKKLEFHGVGFRAEVRDDQEEQKLILSLGFSRPKEFVAPPGISFKIEKNIIIVSGADKQLVGDVAASLRRIKPVEPYKGKGIKYVGEEVRRKVGKAVAKVGEEGV